MTIFVDTSAIYAFLDADDDGHSAVLNEWQRATDARDVLVTSNYVLAESIALSQNRGGIGMLRDLVARVAPAMRVEWIGQDVHEVGLAALLLANRRDLSLVDCTSFELMRRLGLTCAFALDPHFREQGFEVVP